MAVEVDDTLVVDPEQLVLQVRGDDDTAQLDAQRGVRLSTCSEWPPEPPLPADVELAQGTVTDGPPADVELARGTVTDAPPATRKAGIYAAVRRPTTSGGGT